MLKEIEAEFRDVARWVSFLFSSFHNFRAYEFFLRPCEETGEVNRVKTLFSTTESYYGALDQCIN